MSLINKLREACISGRKNIDNAFKAYMKADTEAKQDKGLYMRSKANEKLQAYENEMRDAREKIDNLHSQLVAEIKVYFTASGDNLTADAELFKDGLPILLTLDEIKQFSDKYSDNMTMMKIIHGYLEKHYPGQNILRYESESMYIDIADKLHSYALNGLRDNVIYDNVITNDSNWNKVSHPDIMNKF